MKYKTAAALFHALYSETQATLLHHDNGPVFLTGLITDGDHLIRMSIVVEEPPDVTIFADEAPDEPPEGLEGMEA